MVSTRRSASIVDLVVSMKIHVFSLLSLVILLTSSHFHCFQPQNEQLNLNVNLFAFKFAFAFHQPLMRHIPIHTQLQGVLHSNNNNNNQSNNDEKEVKSMYIETNTNHRANTRSDTNDTNRRVFLTNSISTVSSLTFISLINNQSVWAEESSSSSESKEPIVDMKINKDGDENPEIITITTTTTPSISEGELTASSPPPYRVKDITTTTTTTTTMTPTPLLNNNNKIKSFSSSPDPRFFIAGGASAAISHGITTPIDVVKTRMQSDTSFATISSPIDVATKIVEKEGPSGLIVGLGPTVIGYGLEGALKFGVYESLKPIFLTFLGVGVGGSGSSNGEAYLAAAVCAGALASVILCPMEETRIRLVTDPTFGKGLLDGLPKLLKEEGVFSPFQRGMPPMLAKQVPYTMGKQVSFDIFAGMLYTFLLGLSFVPQKEIALEVEIGAAFLASIVACLFSHPGDVLLTATYKNNNNTDGLNNESNDFVSTIRNVYSDGGVSAFFRGLNARFLHVGCIITFQLVIYDQIKQALGLPASGS